MKTMKSKIFISIILGIVLIGGIYWINEIHSGGRFYFYGESGFDRVTKSLKIDRVAATKIVFQKTRDIPNELGSLKFLLANKKYYVFCYTEEYFGVFLSGWWVDAATGEIALRRHNTIYVKYPKGYGLTALYYDVSEEMKNISIEAKSPESGNIEKPK